MPSIGSEVPTQSYHIADNLSGHHGDYTGFIAVQQDFRPFHVTDFLREASDILDTTSDPDLRLIPVFTDERNLDISTGMSYLLALHEHMAAIATFGSSDTSREQGPTHLDILMRELGQNGDDLPVVRLGLPRLSRVYRNRELLTRRLSQFHHEVGKVAVTGNRFVISLPDNVF
jgi:hypothetical protein